MRDSTTPGVGPRRATSADVAAEAGVSRATVSYVLNNTPHQTIPDATRQRVLGVAARLNYAPSAAARALSRGRSDIVLVLLPAELPPHPQFIALIEYFSAALGEAGLTLVTHPWSRGRRPLTAVWSAISPIAVLALSLEDTEVTAMRESGIEVVLQFFGADWLSHFSLEVQQQIAHTQVQALTAAGHRRLGIALPDDQRLAQEGAQRADCLREACAAAGLPVPLACTVGSDVDAAADAVTAWRTTEPVVTGVCAYDDTTALAVLAGMGHHQLTAPADLAVVGLYDLPVSKLSQPPLSTIAIDSEAMARYAATGLLRCIAGGSAPRGPGPTVARFVERQST